jgi:sigma-B regulation protein RsbU (phosphoserine phosphatase)
LSEDGEIRSVEPPAEDLEDLYENAPCGYISLLPDGRIFKVNSTFCRWIGFTSADLIGRRLQDSLNIAGRIFFETHFAPLLRMQGFFNEVALDFTTRSGERLPVLVNATEKRDAEGNHVFTRLAIFSAADRRRYERELLDARTAADTARKDLQALHASIRNSLADEQTASALREQFIAVLGHDLRNPLAAIESGMHLLFRRPLDDNTRQIVDLVQSSAQRMAGLIDNILDFARGRLGGGLTLQRDADEPVERVLRQVVVELQTGTPGSVIEMDFNLTVAVNCDRRRIGQLASNLLGNAVTHGASSLPIRVGASTAEGYFELFVANSGKPIPQAQMATIFEPFSRGDLRPSLQGLGLGLYISHSIATAHGGTLEVVSDPDETRFTFRMPLQQDPGEEG